MRRSTHTIGAQVIAICESEGQGPDVLMLHGNSTSSHSFFPQLNSPLGQTYHLVALDLPGHGRSFPAADPKTDYSIPGYASIVAQVVSHLGIGDLVLVGHSLGGHVVLEALEYLPQVKGCLIFGAPPLGHPPAMDQAFHPHPALTSALKGEFTEQEVREWAAAMLKDGTPIPQFLLEDFQKTDKQAREFLGQSIAAGKIGSEMEIVANLTCPLAVVHGADEKLIQLEYLQSLKMPTLWRKQVQIIPNSAHFIQLEAPDQMNHLLAAFLAEVNTL